MANRVLILGHPKSGTLYMTVVLRTLGLWVEHEREGRDGSVTGLFYNGSWNFDNYDTILHQVRDPEKVISSAVKTHGKSITHLMIKTGVDLSHRYTNRLLMIMKTWMAFTDWADEKAKFWYRVEDVPKIFSLICMEFGLPEDTKLPPIPDNINQGRCLKRTYADMSLLDAELTEKIKSKAKKYGYLLG